MRVSVAEVGDGDVTKRPKNQPNQHQNIMQVGEGT